MTQAWKILRLPSQRSNNIACSGGPTSLQHSETKVVLRTENSTPTQTVSQYDLINVFSFFYFLLCLLIQYWYSKNAQKTYTKNIHFGLKLQSPHKLQFRLRSHIHFSIIFVRYPENLKSKPSHAFDLFNLLAGTKKHNRMTGNNKCTLLASFKTKTFPCNLQASY